MGTTRVPGFARSNAFASCFESKRATAKTGRFRFFFATFAANVTLFPDFVSNATRFIFPAFRPPAPAQSELERDVPARQTKPSFLFDVSQAPAHFAPRFRHEAQVQNRKCGRGHFFAPLAKRSTLSRATSFATPNAQPISRHEFPRQRIS